MLDPETSVLEVTPGLPSLQWPSAPRDTPIDVAVGFGRVDFSQVTLEMSSLLGAVDFAATSPGRITALDTSIVTTSLREASVSECYIETEPGLEDVVSSYATAVLAPAGTSAIPMRTGRPSGTDGQAWLDSSPHLPIVLSGVIVVLLIGCGASWSRRHEQAVYQQLGVGVFGVMIMSVVEWILTIVTPVCFGATTAILLAAPHLSARALDYSVLSLLLFATGTALCPLAVSALNLSLGKAMAGKL